MKSNLCPYCNETMQVTRMSCQACEVAIDSAFATQRLGQLPVEHQRFIEMFVLAGGSLKEIAKQTGVSYPTVRSRLDRVIAELRSQILGDSKSKPSVLNVFDDSTGDEPADVEARRLIKRI